MRHKIVPKPVHSISVFVASQLPGDFRLAHYDGFVHMPASDSVFVEDAKDLAEVSQL